MNKREYETAEMEIELFALEDVICTSGTEPGPIDDGELDL